MVNSILKSFKCIFSNFSFVTMLQILLTNEYGILVFVCFGWHEMKRRYCLLSVGLWFMCVSIFVPCFITITSRNGCCELWYSIGKFKSRCKVFKMSSSSSSLDSDFAQGKKTIIKKPPPIVNEFVYILTSESGIYFFI